MSIRDGGTFLDRSVKVRCPRCGPQRALPDNTCINIAYTLSGGSRVPVEALCHYTFICTLCHRPCHLPILARVATELMARYSGDDQMHVYEVPAEALEPKPRGEMTTDDVLDLIIEMNEAEW